jgi:type I restriction enzyme S subunit
MAPSLPPGTTAPRGLPHADQIDWPLIPCRELFDLKYGKALVEANRRPGNVPVYGTNGRCGSHDEALFKGPGVILGRKGQGPLGVEWSEADYWVIDTAYSLHPRSSDTYLKYAYYLIKHIGLNHLKDGTSNPTLSRDTFGAQALPLPPREHQRAIAHILGTLDDKIELSQRMNETLEAIALALFQSWFVDFDPVRAKAEGRDPGLPPHLADLFPDSFEDSELGEIPRGWEVKSARELTSYLSRGIGPAYVESGGICVLNQKCIRDRRIDFAKARRHDPVKRNTEGRLLKHLDILVNSTGTGTLGRAAQLLNLPEPAIVDSHITVLRAAPDIDPWFLGIGLTGRESEIENLGEGSTGQTELSRKRLGELPCVVPPIKLQRQFGAIAEPLLERLARIQEESTTLATLRDTLLPRLISGELRIRDAERITAEHIHGGAA